MYVLMAWVDGIVIEWITVSEIHVETMVRAKTRPSDSIVPAMMAGWVLSVLKSITALIVHVKMGLFVTTIILVTCVHVKKVSLVHFVKTSTIA